MMSCWARVLLVGAGLWVTCAGAAQSAGAGAGASSGASAAESAGSGAPTSSASYYLPMPDGVRLAVSVWFPEGKPPKDKIPVVLVQTRYGRAGVFKFGEHGGYSRFLAAGFAVAIVDTRGSTSSFGSREVEIGPQEIADMDSLIRHFKQRPWSSGEVIATGVSYMADTADIAAGSAAGLTATIVRESDFDAYLDLFNPGGVANDGMLNVWGGDTLFRDYGRSADPKESLDCGARAADCPHLWPRLQPVDGDTGYELLRAAIASRKRHWQPDDYHSAEFRDDVARNGFTMLSSSPAGHLQALRRQAIPAQYWGSWMDAGTADAALSRYRSLPEVPMEVWITAHSHTNEELTDPFFLQQRNPDPAFDTQLERMLEFVQRVRSHKSVARTIHYYVLGAGEFKTTSQWPPVSATATTLRFGPDHTLGSGPTAPPDGQDHYDVDFSATTGEATRWSTQIGTPAAYADRSPQDAKLLTYTSAPFEADMELVGTPSVTLYIATTSTDPAFFAYLEDIDPQGRSTYLTEGLFRAVHRKLAVETQLPYRQAEPAHSFRRADAQPMVPGVTEEVAFPIFPVAALLKKGHRLRLSLAGADNSVFRRYSGGRPDHWTLDRTSEHPSALTIQLRPWTKAE